MPLVLVARAVSVLRDPATTAAARGLRPPGHPRCGSRIEVEVQRRVGSAQPDQLGALCRVEELVRGADVDEARVAATALRQLSRVQDSDTRRLFDVRVVGVEELEQPRAKVIATDRDASQALPQLVGEDEPGVDDLALLAVAKRFSVAVAPTGSLTSPIIDTRSRSSPSVSFASSRTHSTPRFHSTSRSHRRRSASDASRLGSTPRISVLPISPDPTRTTTSGRPGECAVVPHVVNRAESRASSPEYVLVVHNY